MQFPDPAADGGHDRVSRFFFPVPQAQIYLSRPRGSGQGIFREAGKPDGRGDGGHARERIGLIRGPKGKKAAHGIPAEHILLPGLTGQLQDLFQRFSRSVTEGRIPEYRRRRSGGEIPEPVDRSRAQQETIPGKFPDDIRLIRHPFNGMDRLNQYDGGMGVSEFICLHFPWCLETL